MKIWAAVAALAMPCLATGQPTREPVARLDMKLGIPLVQVRINGQGPFAFVLDTGTNCEAIVAPRLAKRLGLPAVGSRRITDLGGHGTRTLATVELSALSLGGADFHGVRAVVADLPDGDSVLDGILGFGLFRSGLLVLDYPRHRLTVKEGSLAGGNDERVVPMRMPNGIPLVEITVAGTKVEAGIDSGGLRLSIPASMAAKARFSSSVDTVAFGRTQVSSFALRGAVLDGTVEFASFRFDQPWVEINSEFPIANLGSGAMRDFVVTFDQRNKLVRFASAGKVHPLVKPRNAAWGSALDELVGTVAVTQVY